MVAAVPPIIEPILESVSFLVFIATEEMVFAEPPILESVSFLVTYLLEHVSLIRIAPKLVILVYYLFP